MQLAFASDHAGVQLKKELVDAAKALGHDVTDFGPASTDSVDYPDFATKVTDAVTAKTAQLGVLICGTGIGMSISANKINGIRAALCHTEFEARATRSHNDANILCLGQRVTGAGVAIDILKVFIGTSFEGGRHQKRVEKIAALESRK